ncbi:MAG TPA: tetratricopeptide repeat protein [Bdellovibrionota bacterium]|nr:tetratricopeptide repeat protein [Bdellovibrionota bacterium]
MLFCFCGLFLSIGDAEGAPDGPKIELKPVVESFGSRHYVEAEALLAQRKWADAAIAFRIALRKNPDFTAAAMGLARALAFSGRREEALSLLWRFVDREKGSRRDALIRRARVISRLFLTSATFQTFQEGMNLLLAKKYRPARDRFEKALEYEPDNIEILTRVGQCLVLDKDFDSAAERLRFAKRLNPHEPELRIWLGRSMHQRGEIREALEELRLAHLELQGSELAPVWLAEAQFSFGQKPLAIQTLEEDVKARPHHIESLLTLARLRIQTATRETQTLWSARKDLQLALSRLESYKTLDRRGFPENELTLDVRRTPEEIKSDADKLLQQIENRLEQAATQ